MDQCRLCGLQKYLETFCNLHDSELSIEAKIERCFGIKLIADKLMPQLICFECLAKLEDALAFLDVINETQANLIDALNQQLINCETTIEINDEDIKMEQQEIITECYQPPQTDGDETPKNRKKLKDVISTQGTVHSSRWRGLNPVIRVEDIFARELKGLFEVETETLNLDDSDKNIDGTLTELGLQKTSEIGWSSYLWKCTECNLIVDTSKSLEQHFKAKHKKIKCVYPCMDCTLIFKSYFSFQNHVIDMHKAHLKFCCDDCSEFRWNLVDLYKHRQKLHPRLKNTCLYCGRLFDCGFNLKQHSAVHIKYDDDELFRCDLCGFTTHTKFLVKQHLMASHVKSNVELICEQCGKVCKRLADMVS